MWNDFLVSYHFTYRTYKNFKVHTNNNQDRKIYTKNKNERKTLRTSFRIVFSSSNSRGTSLVLWMVRLLEKVKPHIHELPNLCLGLHFFESLVNSNVKQS